MRRPDSDLDLNAWAPGDWCWRFGPTGLRYLTFLAPTGGAFSTVPVDGPGGWHWDGNVEAPTLSPSLRVYAIISDRTAEGWHGFLTAGVLR